MADFGPVAKRGGLLQHVMGRASMLESPQLQGGWLYTEVPLTDRIGNYMNIIPWSSFIVFMERTPAESLEGHCTPVFLLPFPPCN